MIELEWPRLLSLAAHELRSPAVVISGYARMLREGRLDDAGRADALAQIERAAVRLSRLGREASDLAKWLGPVTMAFRPVALLTLIQSAIQTLPSARAISIDPAIDRVQVGVRDAAAAASALGVIIESVAREAPDDRLSIHTRDRSTAGACGLLIAPERAGDVPDAAHGVPMDLNRGGLGLGLILSATVIEAHGGRTWTCDEKPYRLAVEWPLFSEE